MGALKYYDTATSTWKTVEMFDGTNSRVILSEEMSGTIDGTNAVFTTAQNFAVIDVYVNGVHMRPGAANDYTITGGNQITFTSGAVPVTGSSVSCSYATSSAINIIGTASFITNEVPAGAVNGSNAEFTTSKPYVGGSLQVFVNGILQSLASGHYTETTPSSGIFTLSDAPLTGDVVTVIYQSASGMTGNADVLDGFHASATPVANTIPVLDSTAKMPRSTMPIGVIASDTRSSITNATTGTAIAAGPTISFVLTQAASVRINLDYSVNMTTATTTSPGQAVVEIRDAGGNVVMRRVPTIPNNNYNYDNGGMTQVFSLPAGSHTYSMWLRTSTNCNNIGKDGSSDVQLTAEIV